MFGNQRSLHFTTDEAYQGFAEVKGILKAEKDRLILEYQMKDAIIGFIKSAPKFLEIPFEELVEVEYKINWAKSRFRLKVNSMRVLGEFPVENDGIISLKIKRKQKQSAKELASWINLRLSEYRLEQMDNADDTLF